MYLQPRVESVSKTENKTHNSSGITVIAAKYESEKKG